MRAILQKRALRYVFGANLISMLGSGMNSAAVAWYILQATHSEMALGMFAVLQTIPAMLMLPFTGVIIDREDRRRLVMMLDAGRAVIILTVAILAFLGKTKVWELYLHIASIPMEMATDRRAPSQAMTCGAYKALFWDFW
jgi:MFS family permease